MKSTKAILVKKGYVKSVVMGDVVEEFAVNPELAKIKGCQLIKPFKECEDGDGSEGGEEDDDEGGGKCEDGSEWEKEMSGEGGKCEGGDSGDGSEWERIMVREKGEL